MLVLKSRKVAQNRVTGYRGSVSQSSTSSIVSRLGDH